MSNKKFPISVHMLTWNSEKTLRTALESIKQCAEILLIDGGSTDDTIKIAKEYGAQIISQGNESGPITDFSEVRNRGLKHATQPWILVLDSDEEISQELMEELKGITQKSNDPAAYYVPRKYKMADGTIIQHASTYPNKRIYFFHREVVTHWIKKVHERVELKPNTPIKDLHGASLAPLGTVEDFKRKNLRYLKIEAAQKKCSWSHWMIHNVLRAIRSRAIATIRLLWIWLLPHSGKRFPLEQEMVRFWYAWKLIIMTCPLFRPKS